MDETDAEDHWGDKAGPGEEQGNTQTAGNNVALQNDRRTPIEISGTYNEISGNPLGQVRTGSRKTYARKNWKSQAVEEENDATFEETQADAQNDEEQGQLARKVARTLPQ